MAKKIFVLRTHSLVSKENSTLCFDSDNEVVIPFPILDELEKISQEFSAKGVNARKILEYLSSFKISELTSDKGVIQLNGSTLRLVKEKPDEKIELSNLKPLDLKCLQIVKFLMNENKKTPVILVTKNAALRIKANSIGIKAQSFKDDLYPTLKEQYTGRIECKTNDIKLEHFYKNGFMPTKDIISSNQIEWVTNMFLLIKSPTSSAIGRYDGKNIVKLNYQDYHPYGITPKNIGQKMIVEALMESTERAPLVIIKGGAGTGKTYQSLAVALEQTLLASPKVYSQILVSSPTQTVGQERLGFLPGEIEDKFNPHLGGIMDNVKILCQSRKIDNKNSKHTQKSLFDNGTIQVQPIGFLRGRTIVNSFFIIDETQNISPDDIKSIVTRIGEGSKFIFLGDPTQIDNPLLNERYNGLVYLSERMKNNPLAWQITLTEEESVRSKLAKEASKIL